MASNEGWVVPAGADARRYLALDVGAGHKRDFGYFKAISDQMNNGGREALLHLLLHRDLSGFNVRDVPETAALAEQKAYSRRGIDQLVEVIADQGILPCCNGISLDIAELRALFDAKHGPQAWPSPFCWSAGEEAFADDR
jgi:hypothetical protein